MKEKKVMKLASRGKRLGAYCLDLIVPAIVSIIFISIAAAGIAAAATYSYNYGYDYGYGYGNNYGYNAGATGGFVAATLIGIILLIAYIVVEIVLFTKSQTIGKAILGLQVVSSENGEPIGFWKMLFREWFVKRASSSVLCLGYIWILIDDKNRGWHDKILDTYVVDLKESQALVQNKPASNIQPSAPVNPTITEKPVETPVETHVEAPVETPIEAPVETPAEETVEPQVETVSSSEPVIEEVIAETTEVTEDKQNDTQDDVQVIDSVIE